MGSLQKTPHLDRPLCTRPPGGQQQQQQQRVAGASTTKVIKKQGTAALLAGDHASLKEPDVQTVEHNAYNAGGLTKQPRRNDSSSSNNSKHWKQLHWQQLVPS